MKKFLRKLFKNKGCEIWWCKNECNQTMTATIGLEVVTFHYCQKHTKLMDKVMEGEEEDED